VKTVREEQQTLHPSTQNHIEDLEMQFQETVHQVHTSESRLSEVESWSRNEKNVFSITFPILRDYQAHATSSSNSAVTELQQRLSDLSSKVKTLYTSGWQALSTPSPHLTSTPHSSSLEADSVILCTSLKHYSTELWAAVSKLDLKFSNLLKMFNGG